MNVLTFAIALLATFLNLSAVGAATLTLKFVTAAAIAYNARQDIETATAAAAGDTFDDLYSNHRTVGVISGISVLLTVIVIEW